MTRKLCELFLHPCSVSPCFLLVFLFRLFSPYLTSSSSLSFLQLNTINYGLHLGIIQTLCLPFSRFTPLRKTLTVNHYLRIEYFNTENRRNHIARSTQPSP